MLGDLDDQLAHREVTVGGQQVHHFLEILHVFLREACIAFFKSGGTLDESEQGAHKYEDLFHSQIKASR